METKKFLKEWSETETINAKKIIRRFLLSRVFESNNSTNAFRYCKTFKQIDNVCGFAYTSSGMCAGLYICNITLYLDSERIFKINGFVMDDKGVVYVHVFDYCERETFLSINN